MVMIFARFFRAPQEADLQTVGFEELRRDLDAGRVHLIDVREPHEFGAGHVPGSSNLPLSQFDPGALPSDRAVVLICLSGGRSARALGLAGQAGRNDVVHFQGGVTLWKSCGGPFSA